MIFLNRLKIIGLAILWFIVLMICSIAVPIIFLDFLLFGRVRVWLWTIGISDRLFKYYEFLKQNIK